MTSSSLPPASPIATKPIPRQSGRFTTRYSSHELLRAVRVIAEVAEPAQPGEVTQRAWDDARATTSFAGIPRARSISHRLELPWREVLRLAFEPPATQDYRLGHHQGEPDQNRLTEEHALAYLRLIAWRLRLDKENPLTRAAYDRERERMLARDHMRYRHGRGLLVPSAHQLAALFGDWPAAVSAAGLTPSSRGGDRGPAPVPIPEALERCYALCGTEPTCTELEGLRARPGVPPPPPPPAVGGIRRRVEARAGGSRGRGAGGPSPNVRPT